MKLDMVVKSSFTPKRKINVSPYEDLGRAIIATKRDGKERWVEDKDMSFVKYKVVKHLGKVAVYMYVPIAKYEVVEK